MKDLLRDFVNECAADSVNAGERAKAEGLEQVQLHDTRRFLDRARMFARHQSRVYGKVSSDDVREWAYIEGLEPHHKNAWGAIFVGKEWVCIGWQRSRIRSNHGRQICLWRLK